MKLSLLIAFFLFSFGTGFATAEIMRAVVLEAQADRIVINRGSADGVKVGQTWLLGPEDATGAVVIEETRERSASGRLRGKADIGNLARLGKERDVAQFVSESQAHELMQARGGLDEKSLDRLRKDYRKAISRHTERRGFVTPLGPGAGGVPTAEMMSLGVEAYNAYRLYDMTSSMGLDPTGFYSPWWLAASAVNMAGNQLARNKMYEGQRVRVDVEVVHWDNDLVDLQTEVMAAERGLSLSETLAQKVMMQQQRGVDKYTVFEVTVKNVGKLPADMANFKYRMFMLSNEDRPISASRVDSVLDSKLAPGDEVKGMVYFPKIVAAGQQKLQVVFENMFGDRGDLEFSSH
ncbi:MAG: hypothetical protein WC314_20205 [Vulcanimicrobiota bacterium]